MKQLPNGCRRGDITVHPANWENPRASVKKDWYIQYRFHDPAYSHYKKYKKGKLCIRNAGVNEFKTVWERQLAIKSLLKLEESELDGGYNPISKKTVKPAATVEEWIIEPETPFNEAIQKALDRVKVSHAYGIGVKSGVKYIKQAAVALAYDRIPIKDIGRRHVKIILEQCGRERLMNPRRFNLYRAYFSLLFKELLELDAVESIPVRDIRKQKETTRPKEVLTQLQRAQVKDHLQKASYRFSVFTELFFHSGGRISELCEVRRNQVDLVRQQYLATIKKGVEIRVVWKTIKTIALPMWEFFLDGCEPNAFVFGSALVDREFPLKSNWVSREWNRLVKQSEDKGGLGIDIDFYSLKHLNTSEVVDALDEAAAARLNSHTSTAMVVGIYDVKQAQRKHDKLKDVANAF